MYEDLTALLPDKHAEKQLGVRRTPGEVKRKEAKMRSKRDRTFSEREKEGRWYTLGVSEKYSNSIVLFQFFMKPLSWKYGFSMVDLIGLVYTPLTNLPFTSYLDSPSNPLLHHNPRKPCEHSDLSTYTVISNKNIIYDTLKNDLEPS